MRQRRVGEHAIGDQPIARAAAATGEVVANDPKIVHGGVRELRAAGAFADRPDIWRTRFQALVDANVAAIVELDTGLLQADAVGVRNAARGNQNVAALDRPLGGARAHGHADLLSGAAAHAKDLGRQQKLNAFGAEDPLQFLGDVRILAAHDPRPGLDDRHAAAETAISLRQF
jgi:hypothetical protein